MASRLLDRLKRSLFKEGQGAEPEPEPPGGEEGGGAELDDERLEAELAEEDECVSERLGGTLCFDGGAGGGGREDGGEGEEGSGMDSDSDFLGESMEEGLSSTDASPVGVSSPGSSPSVMQQLQHSWRSLTGSGGPAPSGSGGSAPSGESLLFEVTDASVVLEGTSKYVLYTIHVVQSGSSDKTPAVITRRYSDFQRLHAALRRNHGDQMQRVCFPRKKLRRNFTAETIAQRSWAFEQYLSHLCSLSVLRGALCVRLFFYLSDLQTGQLLIRVGQHQEALGPLLNAKRLQCKLGWDDYRGNQSPAAASSHWLFTLVALASCFQEVEQLEEAHQHCQLAVHALTPLMCTPPAHSTGNKPLPLEEKLHPPLTTPLPPDDKHHPPHTKPHPLGDKPPPQTVTDGPRPPELDKPHPLLVPLLRAIVRLSWQTGRDKRQWEELLLRLEEQWAGLDNQPIIKEFLVKHNLREAEDEG